MVMPGTRPRVCHIISADLWAGAAAQVYETVMDLRARGIGVSVAVFNDGVFARRVDAAGLPWKLFDERQLGTLGLARGVGRFVAEQGADCLHAHAYKEHIVGWMAARFVNRSVPIVRTFHGRTLVPPTLSSYRRLRTAAIGQVERRLLRSSVLIAVSNDLEQHLRRTYPTTTVRLVPNGIRMPESGGDRDKARARWGVAPDAFWVGCVARLEPVKNLACLVRAAAELRGVLPNLRVSIFGTGSTQAALEDLVAAERLAAIVTLHGFTDDVPGTVCGFDCFVLSSVAEGLPMSLLEAMALGVPPVCSRVGGMVELVRPGETGLLFDSNDHLALAGCLRQIHDSRDEARRMGAAARRLIRDSYSIEATNDALVRVYESVLPVDGHVTPRMNGDGRP